MKADDVKRLHALCVVALRRAWSESDIVVGSDVVADALVEFGGLSVPRLTDDGYAALRRAIAGMSGVETYDGISEEDGRVVGAS